MAKIDDSVKKKVPELRFPGFTDDWEERKLGEVGKTKSGIGFPDAQQGGKQGTPFYKVSDMNNPGNEVVMMNANNYASDSQLKENKWNPINPQNSGVVFAKVGAAIFLDRKRIVDTSFLIDNNMMSYLFDSSWNRYFGKTLFEKLRLSIFAQVGALPSFNGSDVEDIKVMIPEESEQKMIGDMFEKLDDIIALHQRKLDLLKEQKKGYLQKMFPKNGAKVPELRFAGFADDWEQRKLGDISYKVKEKNKTGEFTETLTNSAEYGIINQRDFFDKDISNAKNLTGYYVVKNDDFVYNPRISNFAPVGPIKRNKLGRTGVMSPLYYVFRTHDIDKNYFEKYFDTVYWHRFMELNGDSGARADRFAIKDSVFVEMPIPYPTMDEQQKIGSFFKQLDDTIALHQCKLDLLKEQKKGFLQKMFV
ncbi:restriction endonuclease subunit S (plasmid) [Lactococcus lactis subsp. lactis]|uniref:restriction endonuclease subunit S n=2 Tax=Lactococcus TaxID=1357 RepID=UPI001AE255D0|nr:restriction endonuclease subunit S [Lactococcus lactis]QTP13304.2 restriction endonuclease subunit S [Lactococcus lactis subsp. lactis]